ncbi:MAG: glycosyltransferase family 2 protein, partial [Fusobacteriaceae bacterium]
YIIIKLGYLIYKRGEKMITVLTPTYNREKYLPRLYNSLINQSSKNLEWVVIDDGSTDLTEELLNKYILEKKISILYKKQKNSGKMKAVNMGVKIANGEYIFIVDSDDFITEDAIELIETYDKKLPKDFAGMVFRKFNISGKDFGEFPEDILDSNPIEAFYKKKILGDKAEIFRRKILEENPFPEIKNEKFIPEGLVWNRIGRNHLLRYVNKIIYKFEYIEDGYTNNFNKIFKKNPEGFKLYYKEMIFYNIPLMNKFKFFIRYLQAIYYSRFGGGE